MTSLPSALASITLSFSLALGSTVALAAPAAEAPVTGGPEDTGISAEEKSEAEDLSEKAIAEFSAKNYEGAVALFQQAYDIDPQPNYLFNIGRVYEEAGNLEKAVEFYAKFVKQPGVGLDSREVALERLRVLRAILQETADPKEEPKDEPKEEPKETVDQNPPPPVVDAEAQRKRKTMRGAGFALVGVGAAALIGGAVVGSLAQTDRDKAFDRDEADSLTARQDFLGSSQTKAVTADVLFGVGGALLLSGVVLVAIGLSKPKAKTVALTPSFGPTGGGLDLRLQF